MAKKNRKTNAAAENAVSPKGGNVLTTPAAEQKKPKTYRGGAPAQGYSIYDDAVAPGETPEE